MKKLHIKFIVIIIAFILTCIIYNCCIYKINEYFSNMINKKWIIRDNCMYIIPETLKTILNEIVKFKKTIYIPCTYENINLEYDTFEVDKNGIYFLIDEINLMIAKEYLYKYVREEYGIDKTLTLLPKSWIIFDEKDKFIEEYDPKKIYIIKKNIQRQNGIIISRDLTEIRNLIENQPTNNYKYIVIQELLQDPYLIDGRKINLRVYVLVTKIGDVSHIYVYGDGFMYYTAEKFKYNSDDPKVNITTGYIDRQVYAVNPLTHEDFKEYLTKKHGINKSKLVFDNINNTVKDVFSAFLHRIGNSPKLLNNLKFQLFGVDVAIDDKFGAKIMEINKGPDLGAKDKRDSLLKHNLVRNIFDIVGLADMNIENKFIKLL